MSKLVKLSDRIAVREEDVVAIVTGHSAKTSPWTPWTHIFLRGINDPLTFKDSEAIHVQALFADMIVDPGPARKVEEAE